MTSSNNKKHTNYGNDPNTIHIKQGTEFIETEMLYLDFLPFYKFIEDKENRIMKKQLIFLLLMLSSFMLAAQAPVGDVEIKDEGEGPFDQLIIRGATLINSTGAPPIGPVDIIIEDNIIKNIKTVGYPGVPIDTAGRTKLKPGGKEIDAEGKYILPGFVDMHGHIGGRWQGAGGEYVFKLWMAHGITTIRDPSCGNGLDWVLKHKELSNQNKITAPRIQAYTKIRN